MYKVIGNGLLANSFKKVAVSDNCTILAAGVSNSSEKRLSEFNRERSLVNKIIDANSGGRIVYFSTTSIYQEAHTPYIDHKLQMEELLIQKLNKVSIFRLPQVVGAVKNTTLVSYFVQKIINQDHLKIQVDAKRSLIGIEDTVRITKQAISNSDTDRMIVNLSTEHTISAFDIASYISILLNKKLHYDLVSGGSNFLVPLENLKSYIDQDDIFFHEDYWKKLLEKYVPLLRSLLSQ